ncbi:T9SS type A sorting domain-containing protein [bacterium]|nr:T9SS type A sorting domain-containing protein [bacterium]
MGKKLQLNQKQKFTLTQKIAIAGGVSAVLVLVIVGIVKLASIDNANAGSICGSELKKDYTITGKFSCNEDMEIKATLTIEGQAELTGEIQIKDGGKLVIANHGTLRADNLKMEGKKSGIEIQPGGWLFVAKADIEEGTFENNGYVEHCLDLVEHEFKSNSEGKKKYEEENKGKGKKHDESKISDYEFKLKKCDMEGDGVFYCAYKKQVKLEGSADIFGSKNGDLSDDLFIVGSKKLKVKRLPKFKVQQTDLELADTLVITDSLDLNGENIDIKTYDLTLPKSFSYHREGNISEYIKTGNTGRYKLKMLSNNTTHLAPIGRNPYLPVAVTCAECMGTDFGMAVTQNVYTNPETLSGLQQNYAVGETWSVISTNDVQGSVTFEVQWNAGSNGTTSSELSGFSHSSATSYYWIKGQSTQWQTDGVHENISVSGSDPYTMQITLNGMTANTEYYFAIGSSGTALPVEFSYIEAKPAGNTIEIAWGTATETNNDFFQVERSQDGLTWNEVQRVKGAGTVLYSSDYIAYDDAPLAGLAYYRVKQVDFDGKFDFSRIVQVDLSGNSDAELQINSLYPNPFTNQLAIDCNLPQSARVSIDLLNSSGQPVKHEERELPAGQQIIKLEGLDALQHGAYILKLQQGAFVKTKQVIKN